MQVTLDENAKRLLGLARGASEPVGKATGLSGAWPASLFGDLRTQSEKKTRSAEADGVAECPASRLKEALNNGPMPASPSSRVDIQY